MGTACARFGWMKRRVQLHAHRRSRTSPSEMSRITKASPLWVDSEGLERDLVTLLALHDGASSRVELERFLDEHGVRDERGRKVTAKGLIGPLQALVARGLIVEHGFGFDVHPAVRWPMLRAAAESGRLRELTADSFAHAETHLGRYGHSFYRGSTPYVRAKVLLGTPAEAREAVYGLVRFQSPKSAAETLTQTLGTAPDPRWLQALSAPFVEAYLETLTRLAVEWLEPIGDAALEEALSSEAKPIRARAARVAALRGRAVDLQSLGLSPLARAETGLFVSFIEGRYAEARADGELADRQKPGTPPRKLSTELHVPLALSRIIASGMDGTAWARLLERRAHEDEKGASYVDQVRLDALDSYVEAIRVRRPFELDPTYFATNDTRWDDYLSVGLYYAWAPGKKPPAVLVTALEKLGAFARSNGYVGAARHLEETLEALRGEPKTGSLASAHRPRAAWEMALDSLEALVDATPAAPSEGKASRAEARLLFELRLLDDGVEITPRRFASGRARVAKPIAVDALLRGEHPYLTDHDRAVLALSESDHLVHWSGRRGAVVQVLRDKALPALVGHPRVVDELDAPLRVSRGEGELRAESVPRGKATRLSLHPPELQRRPIVALREAADHVVVYERNEELDRVARLLEHGPIEVPEAGSARLGAVLGRLGQKVRVGAGGSVALEGALIPAEARPALFCRFHGTQLVVQLRAAPLGLAGPHVALGRGPAQLMAVVDGTPLRTERDLAEEKRALGRLFDAAPWLDEGSFKDDALALEGLEEALDFLVRIGEVDPSLYVLAWPEGAALPAPIKRGVEHLQVSVGERAGWLSASVALPVDGERVLHFRELLARRVEGGRYIRLDDGAFVALTGELVRRLDALETLGAVDRHGELEASPLLLPRLIELTEDIGARKLDRASKKRLRALEDALSAEIDPPANFGAELRDYQEQGFVFLARLAEAGLGACLADDMGLGKTVQTLALLTHRARLGGALVVAPTSVVGAWTSEARRFAPYLELVTLTETSDREGALDQVGAGQLVVTSYGVLVTESEALSRTRFATVVFDEAHMLKNPRTQRAKAAFAIDAGFRLALTGTPVENHLGELWSVMNAVLPGLLGTEKDFASRFVEPIARGDRQALAALRTRLRPFLLRRTKGEVLDELPERSETTLLVEPAPDERAFYEALRERALARLEGGRLTSGQARARLLAEITRLRQAAVDPRLLDSKDAPSGAKLEVLVERIVALHEEGHRPLVFTQFLGSIALIEARLAEEGLRVLTLDGSLSPGVRSERVAAFQAGEADAFVMSLHAGGVGVTLTAADYVFHVDPWWNPAVEAQATGRAHRIGQRRPVHVYRLVTAGSIEEKILALHRTKKQLAGDLLEGLDEAQKLDLETLRGLLLG
jgi:superfamily II DNA or RNA helicase